MYYRSQNFFSLCLSKFTDRTCIFHQYFYCIENSRLVQFLTLRVVHLKLSVWEKMYEVWRAKCRWHFKTRSSPMEIFSQESLPQCGLPSRFLKKGKFVTEKWLDGRLSSLREMENTLFLNQHTQATISTFILTHPNCSINCENNKISLSIPTYILLM